uniref:Uncharacterized protein n=1 Tax=Oryza punctata TaxID=4537 RepID=A0A0E0M5D9_ORYPU
MEYRSSSPGSRQEKRAAGMRSGGSSVGMKVWSTNLNPALKKPRRGGFPVAGLEAAEEAWVGDDEAPAAADDGGAGEGGWQRREAEEDLGEKVVVFQRLRRRGGTPAAASHTTMSID